VTSHEGAGAASGRYPLREARARRTFAAVVAAAGELFAERGYPATTIADIAERAGVGRATVFTAVPGGKPDLLKLARDRALAGDDEDIPIPQRSWFREAMAQTDPVELLRRQAGSYRQILHRAASVEGALEVGAEIAPELAELRRTATAQRRFGARLVADRLAELTPLRDGLNAQAAADTITVLISSCTYRLLINDYGWSPDEYENWLADQLVCALLPADAQTASRPVDGA
jgi:AcrR family transcriptional regulator